MQVRGPVGRFKYTQNMCHTIGLLAGGTGLTPCLQVIRTILEGPGAENDLTNFIFFYQNRTEEDILLIKVRILTRIKQKPYLYRYYGVINLTSAYGDEFDISKASAQQLTDIRNALVSSTVINQSKQSNQLSSATFTNPGAYHIFMAWPAADYTAGVPSKFIFNNNEVNIFTLLKTENLANQNGYSTSYKFFISNKKQSSITLSII